MAKGLGDLGKRLNVLTKGIETNSKQAVRAVAEAVGPVLVGATPVDTGRARANWQGNVGSAPTGVLFQAPSAPPNPEAGYRIGVSSIFNAAADYKGESAGIFISNNLEYIQRLNDGYSKQAPAGFVEKSLVAAIRTIRTIKLLP